MNSLPVSIEDVTPEWLSEFLSLRFPGTRVDQLAILDRSDGTATRVALGLQYAPGQDNGLPAQMFLKSLLADQIAPLSMFLCEVEFYRQIRPELTIETPRVFGCELDTDTSRFVVLMEDVAARGASFGVATQPCSAPEVASVLDAVAGLHAEYWQSPRLKDQFDWLETHLEGANASYFRDLGPGLLEKQFELAPYKCGIFDPSDFYNPERLWKAFWQLQEINEADQATMLHGDVHVGNTYVLPDGSAGLLDWQLMRIGSWAHDVAYIIVTALTPDDRRRHEADLVRRYLETLCSNGVSVPGWDEAWERYRQNVIWGILMWLMTPTELYDQRRLEILLERHRTAAEDLDSFAALRCG